jgi:hypothetical protein
MAPESNQEKLRWNLFFAVSGVLNNLVLSGLSNFSNTLENSSKFSDCEGVVELSWSWKKLSFDSIPN